MTTMTKSSPRYRRLRLICLGLTAFLFIGHYLLPAKYMPLPVSRQISELYGYADSNRGISAHWMDDRENGWICDYEPTDAYGCGWVCDWTGFSAKAKTCAASMH